LAADVTRIAGASAPRPSALERGRSLASRVPTPALLAGLVVLVSGLNVWWRTMETRPPHWDMGHHLANSVAYLHSFSFGNLLHFVQAYLFYPPLVYWISDIFYAVLGNDSISVAVLSNVVWLGILVFATFAVGRRLWSTRVGWMSVVFVLAAPMVVGTSKEYMLDLPLTAMSALALYLLIRAKEFSSRRYSVLFGLCCGFALLVKWTFPLVVALPVLHAAATALSQRRLNRDYRPLVNLLLAGAATFAVAGFWYVHNFSEVVGSSIMYNGREGELRGDPPVATLASGLWYFWNALDVQLYAVPVLLAVAGFVYCVRRRAFASRNLYPLLMAVGTYLTFTLLRHKDPRYTLPMLPALAIIATSWLEYAAARTRAWIEGAFVAYSAVAFLAISFGTSFLPTSLRLDVHAPRLGLENGVTAFAQQGYIVGPPTHEDWHQGDAFTTIGRVPQPQRTFAYDGPDTVWFNLHGLSYYTQRYRVRWVEPSHARFFLVRNGSPTTPRGFVRLQRWELPDGGRLALYERD
jgi:hypothetical protein